MNSARFWIRTGIVVAVLVGLYLLAGKYLREYFNPQDIIDYIEQAGPWAPVAYLAISVFVPIMPEFALCVAAGAIFGLWWGLLWAWLGCTLGLIGPFWITRIFGRKPLERLLAKTGNFEKRVEKFQCSVEKHGWQYVAFCRLIPLIPFGVLNYTLGLTRISFWTYLWSSSVFILPAVSIYVYVGHAGRAVSGGAEGIWWKAAIALAILALLALLPRIIAKIRGKSMDDGCDDK